MKIYLIGILTMGGLGLFFAAFLALAYQKLKVEENPKINELLNALPGLNCAACGFTGCYGLAEKAAQQGNLDNLRCPPGGDVVASQLAEILGTDQISSLKKIAVVRCGGGKGKAFDKGLYHGIITCAAAELVAKGYKSCEYGCLGFADCVRACPFDAIRMGADDLPFVNPHKCTACDKCVAACPRDIIVLNPCAQQYYVNCNSLDKGVVVRKNCTVGCISCNICVKASPQVFKMENNLAYVYDHSKCDSSCDAATEKCPTKCIVKNY
ncbi:MAG: RnfABCDGE type electron transport complex subunit B [bacterium]